MRRLISLLVMSALSAPLLAATPTETVTAFHDALSLGKADR